MSRLVPWLVLSSIVSADAAWPQSGSSGWIAGSGPWEVRAELHVVGGAVGKSDSLVLAATLVNRTDGTLSAEFGACPIRLRAFRTADRAGTPVWRSELRAPWDGEPDHFCPLYLRSAEVGPGEDFSPDEFVLRVPVAEVLADSLPDATYHFVAELVVGSLSFELPVGHAELRMERQPLPDRRETEGLGCEVQTLVSRTDTKVVRVEVKVTQHARETMLRFAADCPIVLYAFRSRERRDAAPRSGEPVWKEPAGCGEELRELRLGRGQDATFAIEFAARDVLRSTLPSGRYHFAVAVQLENRRVFLAAGEAELRR